MPGEMGKKKKDGPGLWQIFYSDLKPDKDISGRVEPEEGEGRAPRDSVPAAEALFSVEERDDSDLELENDPFIAVNMNAENMNAEAGARSGARKTMVVVSERELTSPDSFFKSKSNAKSEDEGYERSMESINMDNEGQESRAGHFLGNRFRIRRDSDLELALPSSSSQQVIKKFSYCCIYCFKMPIWKTYFTVALFAVLMVVLYVVIVVSIVKGLGG